MSKTSTEMIRNTLNGSTMGTRWSALFFASSEFDSASLKNALQRAVDEVDAQMSTWKPESDLMRLNNAPVGAPIELPVQLIHVLNLGLTIGRASGGAFDIGMGDAVRAWGFAAEDAHQDHIMTALNWPRRPAYELLEVKGTRVCKRDMITIDLNGIAKGYGVDRLAEVLLNHGIRSGLVGIDGEMRALGLRPDGEPWSIAIEAPESDCRKPHSILTLHDGAVATSGDYRHYVMVEGRRLSHTMNPMRGAPLTTSPASVTVVARTCAAADAWATALMVLGPDKGSTLLLKQGLSALFLLRDETNGVKSVGFGQIFSKQKSMISAIPLRTS